MNYRIYQSVGTEASLWELRAMVQGLAPAINRLTTLECPIRSPMLGKAL